MRITCSLDVACVMDCAGNSGARNLYVIGAMGYNGRLNKFPGASPGGFESGHLNKHAFGDDVDPNNKKCA